MMLAAAAGDAGVVAVGQEMATEPGSAGFVPAVPAAWISTDGRTWDAAEFELRRDVNVYEPVRTVSAGLAGFLAVGDATAQSGEQGVAFYSSSDGATWERSDVERSVFRPGDQVVGVPGTEAGYYAYGTNVERDDRGATRLWQSTGPREWTRVESDALTDGVIAQVLVLPDGERVAVGTGAWTGTEANTWSRADLPGLGDARLKAATLVVLDGYTYVVAVGDDLPGPGTNSPAGDGFVWTYRGPPLDADD